MKSPLTGLLILCLTQASFAVLIRGICTLEHATVHDRTTVLFTAISPWVVTDSVETEEDGEFFIDLVYGTYDVEYKHDGYVPVILENQTFIVPTILSTQTLLIATPSLSGALTGTLGPGTYHVVDTISVEPGSNLLLFPGTRFLFDGPSPFLIYGTLSAQGIEGDSVTFTTDTLQNPARWFGLQFKGNGSSGSSLAYCIVENGLASSPPHTGGGGAHCDTASPNFEHCAFRYNNGNGAECRFSSAAFTNCTFRENTGSGVRCEIGSSCAFASCLFTKNDGRGVHDVASSQFTDCQITKNYSGGVSTDSSRFTRCIIGGNAADVGAGVYCGPVPLLEECTISGNLAYIHGGGIAAWGGAPILVNCILSNNIAVEYGGGVLCRVQTALGFVNCTISGNTASIGGGVYCEDSSPAFNSTIISFSEGAGVHFINSATSQFAFCDFYGNSAGNITFEEDDPSEGPASIGDLVLLNANGDSCDIYTNIFLDPLFADASARDFRLCTGSLCIDAGDPNLPFNPDNTVADIGALFYDQRYHPPSAFGLASPEPGDTCWTLDTTLIWYTAFDPDQNDTVTYEVLMATHPNLAHANVVASGLQQTFHLLEELEDDETYYWTIHASDVNTPGTWANDTFFFRTYYPESPNGFELVSPSDGEVVGTTTPTLSWNRAEDPDPNDSAHYHVLWSYDADFAAYEDTMIYDTSFTFPENRLFCGSPLFKGPTQVHRQTTKGFDRLDEVEDDSRVYWKVQAIDQYDFEIWGHPHDGLSFRVFVEEPPDSFALLSPIDGDTLDSLTEQFVWEETDDPDPGDALAFYRFYLAFDSLFTTGLDSHYASTNELLWDSLTDDQTYWWRVKAFDTHGNGTFSNQTRHFITYYCELPPAFTLLEPADSLQLPFEEVNFCWQSAHDPDPGDTVTYTLYLALNDTSYSYEMGADTCLAIDADTLNFTEGSVVEWWVEARTTCPDSTIECASRFHFYPPSAVPGNDALLPTEFALHQNWPNPFNPTTMIRYDVKQTGLVSVTVFDILGREVAVLIQGTVQAGSYTVTWNASKLPSGVYFCQMQTLDFMQTRKLVLVK